MPTTLIATLGGQPQIVSFTLDLLLARGETIDQVIVIYLPGNPRYAAAFRCLAGEFAGDCYAGRPMRLRAAPVMLGALPLAEARLPQEVEAVRSAVYNLLSDVKTGGGRLHLSLSAGRRMMALTALAAAMQHLTPADRLWHLYTPPDLTSAAHEGRILHAPPDSGVSLIEVPFVPWAAYFPGLRPLMSGAPQDLRALGAGWQDEGERARCQTVWQKLTSRQQELLRLLADGSTREQAALVMGIAVSTVDTHRKAILSACGAVWDDDRRIDITFLRTVFGPYLAHGAV